MCTRPEHRPHRGSKGPMADQRGSPGPERRVLLGASPSATEPGHQPGHERGWGDVPWRTIVATVGVVLAVYIGIQIVLLSVQVIAWIFVAGFFAIVLAPVVRRVQRRV